ncbi:MAG: hypothetical protein ACOZFS_11270 [Thermodesulfobacteriota bacterium]
MKSKVAISVVTTAMLLIALNVCLAAKVVFEDRFATLDPAWGATAAVMNVKDGKLLITPAKNTTQTIINQSAMLPNDMEAVCAMTFIQAQAPTWGSGLVFWAKDYDEYYAFLINAQGWFGVQRHVANRYLLPVTWRESDAIKAGEGVENQFKIVTKGNQATVFINGKEVVSFQGQPPQGGSLIGFKTASGTDGTNTVAFANLLISIP